jgi:hypothetical protein
MACEASARGWSYTVPEHAAASNTMAMPESSRQHGALNQHLSPLTPSVSSSSLGGVCATGVSGLAYIANRCVRNKSREAR